MAISRRPPRTVVLEQLMFYYRCFYFCLSNAIHCMGQNIKSLAACFCVCMCAHGYLGPNISKTVRDRGSATMGHQ